MLISLFFYVSFIDITYWLSTLGDDDLALLNHLFQTQTTSVPLSLSLSHILSLPAACTLRVMPRLSPLDVIISQFLVKSLFSICIIRTQLSFTDVPRIVYDYYISFLVGLVVSPGINILQCFCLLG